MASPQDPAAPPRAKKRPAKPRAMTERRLENIARFYLERFSTTAAHMRQVLLRRIDKSLRAQDAQTPRTEMAQWADKVIAKLVAEGLINDSLYADGLARKLRRLGKSPTRIGAALRAKGVAPALIADVIDATAEDADGGDAALRAALAYARRRKLGPFRDGPADPDLRKKDLGALARAGFSFDVARKALADTDT
jgi:regulatory protein